VTGSAGLSAFASLLHTTDSSISGRLGCVLEESDLVTWHEWMGFSESLDKSKVGSAGSSVTAKTWKSFALRPEFQDWKEFKSTLVSGISAIPIWGCWWVI
jgi:hypothetical protein